MGHWMGGLDSSAVSWISGFTRDPFPKKVVWKQDDVTHNRYYWLKVINPLKNSFKFKFSFFDTFINIFLYSLGEPRP